MSVSVTYGVQVTVAETMATNVVAAPSPLVQHTGYNSSGTFTASTSVPVTQVAAFVKTMTSGAATIDFSSLTGTNGATVVGTGLKVQFAKFKNPSTNANNIAITEGVSNGLSLFGASFSVTLAPGQEITFYGNDAAPDVASGDKTIDLAGTGSQTLECMIVLG